MVTDASVSVGRSMSREGAQTEGMEGMVATFGLWAATASPRWPIFDGVSMWPRRRGATEKERSSTGLQVKTASCMSHAGQWCGEKRGAQT